MADNDSMLLGQILERIENKTDQQTAELKKQSDSLIRLETNMTSLIGNGQPGRISKLEDAVSTMTTRQTELDTLKWKLGTLSAFFGAALAFIAQFVMSKLWLLWLGKH